MGNELSGWEVVDVAPDDSLQVREVENESESEPTGGRMLVTV
jgi:hypothetical protein